MKYIIRLLALPFYILIISLFFIKEIIFNAYYFIIYGGEVIVYTEDKSKIHDIYLKVKEEFENENTKE